MGPGLIASAFLEKRFIARIADHDLEAPFSPIAADLDRPPNPALACTASGSLLFPDRQIVLTTHLDTHQQY
jgi:hypothetical protein